MDYLKLGLEGFKAFGVAAETLSPIVVELFGRFLSERGFTIETLDKDVAEMLANPTPDPKP